MTDEDVPGALLSRSILKKDFFFLPFPTLRAHPDQLQD